MDPRAGATEEMGGLMDLDCGQPDNTNIVRNARESLDEDPVAGVGGQGDDNGLMWREPGTQLKHQPASRR